MKEIPVNFADKVITPSGKQLRPVNERTMYPEQLPILLRELLEGKTIREAAEGLGIGCDVLVRVLEGSWKAPKSLRERLGLKVAYILPEDAPDEFSDTHRANTLARDSPFRG